MPSVRTPQKSNAYNQVRRLLLGGEVSPGQRLSHRSLARDLGLSRSPVREALLQLEAEGLIEHRPQSGVYLREVSPRELGELYAVRELIEPYAAERAATMADAAQLERLRRSCDEFTEIAKRSDLKEWLGAPEHRRRLSMIDRDFHTTILAAANNRVAQQFFENGQVITLVVTWNHLQTDLSKVAARIRPSVKQHRQIYDAIRRRDPVAAKKAMRSHISGMSKRVLADLHDS